MISPNITNVFDSLTSTEGVLYIFVSNCHNKVLGQLVPVVEYCSMLQKSYGAGSVYGWRGVALVLPIDTVV
jgi:hypothetical protein